MAKVTFHFPTLEAALDHIEGLGKEQIENAKRAEESGRITKARVLAMTAEGRGMVAAVEMIREAQIGEQS